MEIMENYGKLWKLWTPIFKSAQTYLMSGFDSWTPIFILLAEPWNSWKFVDTPLNLYDGCGPTSYLAILLP